MSLFRRRHRRALVLRLLEYLWPRMGWRRAGRYYAFRIKRLPGTPHSIACGFACGAAVSFTPFMGFHFILGAVLAWSLRGSLFASAIGTAVGNPWTFPGIWFGVLWIGSKVLGREMPDLSFTDLNVTFVFDQFDIIGIPMIIGGIPASIFAWVAFYFTVRRVIANYQKNRRTIRIRRQKILSEERMAQDTKSENTDVVNGLSRRDQECDDLSIPRLSNDK